MFFFSFLFFAIVALFCQYSMPLSMYFIISFASVAWLRQFSLSFYCVFFFVSFASVALFCQCSMSFWMYRCLSFVRQAQFANVLCLFVCTFLFFCVCDSVLPMLYASLFVFFSFLLCLWLVSTNVLCLFIIFFLVFCVSFLVKPIFPSLFPSVALFCQCSMLFKCVFFLFFCVHGFVLPKLYTSLKVFHFFSFMYVALFCQCPMSLWM